MRKFVLGILLGLIINLTIIFFSMCLYKKMDFNKEIRIPVVNITSNINDSNEILITAVGDCTLGYDDNFGYTNSFNQIYENNGAGYFFSNVKKIFEKDDLTIANFEGTLTDSQIKKEKAFSFKAPREYVKILNEGSIEAVNLANNHSYDYYDVGNEDTKKTLENANIKYFGNNDYYIYEKNNIKIGLAGIFCIEDWNCNQKIDKAIYDLKTKKVNSIILSFHWGIEKDYAQSQIQKYLGHYAIDQGADLVLGHHPHVLQGIEKYKDKYIVYSLANFSFGGNKNPKDKDTMLVQIKFKYTKEKLESSKIYVYPASVSSNNTINDYSPILLQGNEATRVLNKIQQYSEGINLISDSKE